MEPPHVSAFQKFEANIPNRLEAGIAFGLFMESEKQWAATEDNPTDAKYRNYQKKFLTDHEIERFAKQARALLSDFGNDSVAVKRAEFLQESLEAYESAARTGHSRFRGHGILEAMIGTLAWTLTLIIFSLVIRYGTIDPVEIYHKVAGY